MIPPFNLTVALNSLQKGVMAKSMGLSAEQITELLKKDENLQPMNKAVTTSDISPYVPEDLEEVAVSALPFKSAWMPSP